MIRVLDFETSGMEPPDAQVCEIGTCDLTQDDDGWVVGQPSADLCWVEAMPPEVRAVHHISLTEARESEAKFDPEPHFWTGCHADGIKVVAAHNVDFEAKFLGALQLPMLCTYKAALRVWPGAPGHSNGVLRYWLEDCGLIQVDADLAYPPHRAGPDAYITAHILKALLESSVTAREMVAWTREPRLLPTCPLGKFRGKPWPEVEGGFLAWMLKQADMEADLKWNAQRELSRRNGR